MSSGIFLFLVSGKRQERAAANRDMVLNNADGAHTTAPPYKKRKEKIYIYLLKQKNNCDVSFVNFSRK